MAWDPWGPVLDDLEERVVAAETGDLSALQGWEPPTSIRPMDDEEQHRANGILGRQRRLLERLRSERAEVAASLAATRRPAPRRALSSAPVYVDRVG
ncbi:hypothetical protein [Amnibacterium endophyticum]|uniref:Flagellar protein FliT n=1 Tax=Amnibacterium endophyticum TaxID=2109337 RepID=A0ABW4LGL5_9MICO